MHTLTIQITEEMDKVLQAEANRLSKPAPQIVQEHLAEWLRLPIYIPPQTARQRSDAILRAAGLLAELSTEEQQQAQQCTTTLAEVRAALDDSQGPLLSTVILEMRGPKI